MDETRLPEWYLTNYAVQDLVSLLQIELMQRAPNYTNLRSYATYRRTHQRFGPMPAPVCKISNRKLWLKDDIEHWLRDRSIDIFGEKTRQKKPRGYIADVRRVRRNLTLSDDDE